MVSVEEIQTAKEYNWMLMWQKTGPLDWEDKNGDGKIQYYNDKSDTMHDDCLIMRRAALTANALYPLQRI